MAEILLVDDEKIVRTLLGVALRRKGHTVVEANSAKSALNALRKRACRPDLLISELSLPKVDAMELLEDLEESPCEVQALFLSRSPHPVKLEQRATESGHVVLREPLGLSSVVEKVTELVAAAGVRKPPSRSGPVEEAKRSATGNG